jgi:hypothetical protein
VTPFHHLSGGSHHHHPLLGAGPITASSEMSQGALIGGSASVTAAVYTQRYQDRLQRVAHEATKRERSTQISL